MRVDHNKLIYFSSNNDIRQIKISEFKNLNIQDSYINSIIYSIGKTKVNNSLRIHKENGKIILQEKYKMSLTEMYRGVRKIIYKSKDQFIISNNMIEIKPIEVYEINDLIHEIYMKVNKGEIDLIRCY